jgi:hypothetical protein
VLEDPSVKDPKRKRYGRVLWQHDVTYKLLTQIIEQDTAIYRLGPRLNVPVKQKIVRGLLMRSQSSGHGRKPANQEQNATGRPFQPIMLP